MAAESTPTEAELIRRALDSGLAAVQVSSPGAVVSYDAATRTATIRPGVQRVLFDGEDNRVQETIPDYPGVPVIFSGGAGWDSHHNLAAGDTGLLVFCSDSFAEWRNHGAVSEPLDLRRFCQPVFVPGLVHKGNTPSATDDSMGPPGATAPSRIHWGSSALSVGLGTAPVVLDALIKAALAAIFAAGAGAGGPGAANFTAAAAQIASQTYGASNLKADP